MELPYFQNSLIFFKRTGDQKQQKDPRIAPNALVLRGKASGVRKVGLLSGFPKRLDTAGG